MSLYHPKTTCQKAAKIPPFDIRDPWRDLLCVIDYDFEEHVEDRWCDFATNRLQFYLYAKRRMAGLSRKKWAKTHGFYRKPDQLELSYDDITLETLLSIFCCPVLEDEHAIEDERTIEYDLVDMICYACRGRLASGEFLVVPNDLYSTWEEERELYSKWREKIEAAGIIYEGWNDYDLENVLCEAEEAKVVAAAKAKDAEAVPA